MIELVGDYQNGYLYGTLSDYKIDVRTLGTEKAIWLTLNIQYGDRTWSHTFDVPFFEGNAIMYINNYVHSVITQALVMPTVSLDSIQINSFELAQVTVAISELNYETDTIIATRSFYMMPGEITPIAKSAIDGGARVLLNAHQSEFLDERAVISYTFLSNIMPISIKATHYSGDVDKIITEDASDLLLHSISIPFKLLLAANVVNYSLRLYFTGLSFIELGLANLMDEPMEHRLFQYQNQFGTVSFVEFTGEFEEEEQFKSDVQEYIANNISQLQEVAYSESKPLEINTGYIWDINKHHQIRALIRSYQKYLVMDGLIRIVNAGTNKIKPYTSKKRLYNETLKFKIAQNDNFSNRIF